MRGKRHAFTWVRCPECGNGLWRDYPERPTLVMALTLRAGQKRMITISRDMVSKLTVTCEKCGALWSGVER